MANEPYNEVVMKAAAKILAGGGGSASDPTVVQGPAAAGTSTAINPVLEGARFNTTLPTPSTGQLVEAQSDGRGNLRAKMVGVNTNGVDGASNSMVFVQSETTNALGETGRLLAVGISKYNGATWDRDKKPNAASRIPSSANSTNATSAKASVGDLFGCYGYNSSATTTYLKLYNKASAPTVGTDTPVLTLPLPPTAAFAYDFASMYFSIGIAYALTTDAADAGTTAVAAGAILGLNVAYA